MMALNQAWTVIALNPHSTGVRVSKRNTPKANKPSCGSAHPPSSGKFGGQIGEQNGPANPIGLSFFDPADKPWKGLESACCCR